MRNMIFRVEELGEGDVLGDMHDERRDLLCDGGVDVGGVLGQGDPAKVLAEGGHRSKEA